MKIILLDSDYLARPRLSHSRANINFNGIYHQNFDKLVRHKSNVTTKIIIQHKLDDGLWDFLCLKKIKIDCDFTF